MKMAIQFRDRIYIGTPESIVDDLWKGMLNPPSTRKEYMEGVQQRIGHGNQFMQFENEKEFLEELDRLGHITIMEII